MAEAEAAAEAAIAAEEAAASDDDDPSENPTDGDGDDGDDDGPAPPAVDQGIDSLPTLAPRVDGDPKSLADCLNRFTAPEVLTGTEAYICLACTRKKRAAWEEEGVRRCMRACMRVCVLLLMYLS